MAKKTWVGNGGTLGDWSVAANWSPVNVPVAADDVRIPAGTPAITGGLNQSAVALGIVIFEEGFNALVASAAAYLQLQCSRFEYRGTGTSYIDFGATANLDLQIYSTASANLGQRGLYLKGTALRKLNVIKGNVGLAFNSGEVSTLTDLQVAGIGADVVLGAGVTLTNAKVQGGKAVLRCAHTNLDIWGGRVITEEVGAITTVNAYGGEFVPNSTGTISTLHARGSLIDFRQSMAARIVSALKIYKRIQGIKFNIEAVTYTDVTVEESLVMATADPAT